MWKIRESAPAVVLAVLAFGCARDKASDTAQRAEVASGEMRRADTLQATIDSIDPETRTVSLHDQEGHAFTVLVGEEVDLERLHPKETVNVTYQESVAFELVDPKSADATQEPATVQESTRRRVPDGVQFGRQIKTRVDIVSIAPRGTSATFRVPEGDLRTVEIGDAATQHKVSNLRPGDSVEVTYTEKLAVALADQR